MSQLDEANEIIRVFVGDDGFEAVHKSKKYYDKYLKPKDKSLEKFKALWKANSHLSGEQFYRCFQVEFKDDLNGTKGLGELRTKILSEPLSYSKEVIIIHCIDHLDEIKSRLEGK